MHHRQKVIGLILVKELALIDKSAHTPVSSLKMRSLPFLRASTPLYDLLHLFEVGRCHMAVLTGPLSVKKGDECSSDMGTDAPSAEEGLQQQGSNNVQAQGQQQQEQHGPMDDALGHDRCWQEASGHSHGHSHGPTHLISTEHDSMILDQVLHAVPWTDPTSS